MKCPKCKKEIKKINYAANFNYYECMFCHYTIGKPTEEEMNAKKVIGSSGEEQV